MFSVLCNARFRACGVISSVFFLFPLYSLMINIDVFLTDSFLPSPLGVLGWGGAVVENTFSSVCFP